MPEIHPNVAAHFHEAPCHVQNNAAAPTGTAQANPSFGNPVASSSAAQAAIATSRSRVVDDMRKWTFAFIVLAACIVAACGRQVTPNPIGLGAGGAAPGFMSVKFDVAAPFNFSTYQYWVVFNTSGNGLTPDTHPFQNNWAAYSSGLEVIGIGGATAASAVQFVKNPSNPHVTPYFRHLITTPQQFQYNANSNGTGTEFTVVFQRSIFNSVSNSPGPSPTPFNNVWRFNAFTTQANPSNQLIFVDSMGAGGPVDPQWNSPPIDIRQCTDNTYYALSSGLQIDPPASIVSVEIANNPSPSPSSNPCSGESPSNRTLRN